MNTDKAWIYYNSPRICPQAPLKIVMNIPPNNVTSHNMGWTPRILRFLQCL